MPITFDTIAELKATMKAFQLTESATERTQPKKRTKAPISLRQQVKAVLKLLVATKQPFTAQDALNTLLQKLPNLTSARQSYATIMIYQVLDSDYPKLKAESIALPHSRRPVKRYLP